MAATKKTTKEWYICWDFGDEEMPTFETRDCYAREYDYYIKVVSPVDSPKKGVLVGSLHIKE